VSEEDCLDSEEAEYEVVELLVFSVHSLPSVLSGVCLLLDVLHSNLFKMVDEAFLRSFKGMLTGQSSHEVIDRREIVLLLDTEDS
jgi:hypothetical protein